MHCDIEELLKTCSPGFLLMTPAEPIGADDRLAIDSAHRKKNSQKFPGRPALRRGFAHRANYIETLLLGLHGLKVKI